MKKIFLTLIALVAAMSINAQVVKVYVNDVLSGTFTNTPTNTVEVVFEDEPEHEYVEIGGVKWATKNVGATTVAGSPSTCYGDYFAWGETEPHYTSMTIKNANYISFSGWEYGHVDGYNAYPSYKDSTLDAAHDAATQNWGADWRTPTPEDYLKLYEACGGTGTSISSTLPIGTTTTTAKGIYWCKDYDGVTGLLFSDGTNKVFFPATGYCVQRDLASGGYNSYYWSSSLTTKNTSAHSLYFSSSRVYPSIDGGCYCWYGCTVRPVSDVVSNKTLVTSITLDKTSLSIEVGKRNTLAATALPADASVQNVTWTSSNPAIATVSSYKGLVTAVAEGTAIITATAKDGSGVSATCAVTVTSAPEVKHEYVEIGGVKWATMNVGATTVAGSPSTCYGDYFAWGETEPRYSNIIIYDEDNVSLGDWKDNHRAGYSWKDEPSYIGTTLDADHDAATQNWGSEWRTPTTEDFLALINACSSTSYSDLDEYAYIKLPDINSKTSTGGIYWLYSDQKYLPEYSGVRGILFVDKTDTSKRVFFPAAGGCIIDTFSSGDNYAGTYWTSSYDMNNVYSRWGYYVSFFSENGSSYMYPSKKQCVYYGKPVRPVLK